MHYFSVLSFMYLHIYSSDRLVDCTSLKRAIEFVYSATLPQASKPFIYMSINLPSEHVDVNIHPTKKEVCCSASDVQAFFFLLIFPIIEQMIGYFCEYFDFQVSLLNQERIIETIKNTIEEKLRNSNTTRIFQTQVMNWLFSTVYLQTCFSYLVPYILTLGLYMYCEH